MSTSPLKSLQTILLDATAYLERHHIEHPRLDAEWLISHALATPRLSLYLQFDRPLVEAQLASIRPLLKRRAGGEPLQYILGNTPFYSVDLEIGPGVLIPRPETERLVDFALTGLPKDTPRRVLDLCTGSGAIALAIARERPLASPVIGVDLSPEALSWATRNRDRLKLLQVEFRVGDLFAPVAGEAPFDLITANPPYITEAEYPALPRDVRDHEPRLALVAADAGLAILRRIAAGALAHLTPGGRLLCEIGAAQGPATKAIFEAAGLVNVEIRRDYAERDRVVVGRRAPEPATTPAPDAVDAAAITTPAASV